MDTASGLPSQTPASFAMPPTPKPVNVKRIALILFLLIAALVIIGVAVVFLSNKAPATNNPATSSSSSGDFWNTSLLGSRPAAVSKQSTTTAGVQTCISDSFTYQGKEHRISTQVPAGWTCTNVFMVSTESYSMTIASNDDNQILINLTNLSPGSICNEGAAGCTVEAFHKNTAAEFKLYRTEINAIAEGQIASTAIAGIGRITVKYRNSGSASLATAQKTLVTNTLDTIKLD